MFKKSKKKKTVMKQLADGETISLAPLPEADLTLVSGGMRAGGGGGWSTTAPSDPDDVYRLDD